MRLQHTILQKIGLVECFFAVECTRSNNNAERKVLQNNFDAYRTTGITILHNEYIALYIYPQAPGYWTDLSLIKVDEYNQITKITTQFSIQHVF